VEREEEERRTGGDGNSSGKCKLYAMLILRPKCKPEKLIMYLMTGHIT